MDSADPIKGEQNLRPCQFIMDNLPERIYQRVVESLFDDGIINMGRALTLYVYTKQFSQQNPQHTDLIWKIYRQTLKGTGYEDITFGRKTD